MYIYISTFFQCRLATAHIKDVLIGCARTTMRRSMVVTLLPGTSAGVPGRRDGTVALWQWCKPWCTGRVA